MFSILVTIYLIENLQNESKWHLFWIYTVLWNWLEVSAVLCVRCEDRGQFCCAPALPFLLLLFLRTDGASSDVSCSCSWFPGTSCLAVFFLLWDGDASAGSSLTCAVGDASLSAAGFEGLDLSFLLGDDRWAEGQVCWLRHTEHSGATGKHTCCPKPTSNQLISRHRSLREERRQIKMVLQWNCCDVLL